MRRILVACGAVLVLAAFAADVQRQTRLSVVQDVPGYNSWPMIATIGERIVCAYSRGSAHTITEGARGVFVRTSQDGGRIWSPEICVVNDPAVGEVAEGAGNDDAGAMLLWIRCWGRGGVRHVLYRSGDGRAFEKIAEPELSPKPMQITDIFQVPDVGLMALWFAGDYKNKENGHSWGTLVSTDNGRNWRQRTVEGNLPKAEWPTEIGCVPVGGARLFAIARSEGDVKRQFQLTSLDGGETWKKSRTNITDVRESTPALVFDSRTGLVSNYYYQRGPGCLWRRTVRLSDIFDHADQWPEPDLVARGGRERPYDSGNVRAVALGDSHCLAYYSGNPTNTSVLVATVPIVGPGQPLANR